MRGEGQYCRELAKQRVFRGLTEFGALRSEKPATFPTLTVDYDLRVRR